MRAKLRLEPQEGMQMEAIQSPADELFMGGQAGPGKSWTLLFYPTDFCFRYPKFRVLILRRHSTELADLLDKATAMYKPLGAKFHSIHPFYRKPTFTFPEYDLEYDEEGNIVAMTPKKGKPNGAMIVFGHMDEERTKYDYGGFEFTHIYWDELPNFLESQYLFMWSRLRAAIEYEDDGSTIKLELKTQMMSTGNPVGVGMLWVKRRFIDPMPPRTLAAFVKIGDKEIKVDIESHPTAKTRMFIPGDRAKNKYVGDDYEGNLTMLGGRDYNALALGKWEIQDSPGQLIAGKWIDHALSGNVPKLEDPILRDRGAVAIDYATDHGSDPTVIMAGPGNQVFTIKKYPYTKVHEACYLLQREARIYGIKDVRVAADGNGAGIGVVDMLQSGAKQVKLGLKEYWNWLVDIEPMPQVERCIEVDKMYTDLWKMRARKNFPNFRSQMYWKLKDDMENGRICLARAQADSESSQYIEPLIQELMAITYEERNGLIYVIKKEELRRPDRLGRSPDFADTLAMWNWVRERTREPVKMKMPWDDLDADEDSRDPYTDKISRMYV